MKRVRGLKEEKASNESNQTIRAILEQPPKNDNDANVSDNEESSENGQNEDSPENDQNEESSEDDESGEESSENNNSDESSESEQNGESSSQNSRGKQKRNNTGKKTDVASQSQRKKDTASGKKKTNNSTKFKVLKQKLQDPPMTSQAKSMLAEQLAESIINDNNPRRLTRSSSKNADEENENREAVGIRDDSDDDVGCSTPISGKVQPKRRYSAMSEINAVLPSDRGRSTRGRNNSQRGRGNSNKKTNIMSDEAHVSSTDDTLNSTVDQEHDNELLRDLERLDQPSTSGMNRKKTQKKKPAPKKK